MKTKIIQNKLPLCSCGCGKEVKHIENKYLHGHHIIGKNYTKGKQLSEEHKLKISKRNKGMKRTEEFCLENSKRNKGKKYSEERKQLIREKSIGRYHSEKTKLRMSISAKNRSENTRVKQSISAIKYIEVHKFDGKPMCPRVGSNEILILNHIEKEINLKVLRNDRKLANISGRFLDGYISKYNLGIDILENHHFKPIGELIDYDQNRELIISWKLGCMIYYISEQEFLKNPDKEIQRFKDFLLLLDQGVN